METRQGLLSRSLQYEHFTLRTDQIVKQEYAVTIRQQRPRVETVRGYLAIVAQPAGGRYASRWTTSAGTFRFAAWRPEPSGPVWSRFATEKPLRQNRPTTKPDLILADLNKGGTSMGELERQLGEWLAQRGCAPISLAQEFAAFGKYDRTKLAVEYDAYGRVATLVAERVKDSCRVIIMLRTEAATGRPVSETVSVSRAQAAYEIDLEPRSVRFVPATFDSAKLFRPEGDIQSASTTADRASVSKFSALAAVHDIDLSGAEIAARFVLHRNDLCLSGPVEVTLDKTARVVRVEGLVVGDTRRQELKAELAMLSRSHLLRVSLQTRNEVAAAGLPAAPASPPQAEPSDQGRVSLLANTYLDGLALSEKAKQDLKDRIARDAGAYVSSGESVLREASALAQLAQPEFGSVLLRSDDAILLSRMRQDHLRLLGEQLRPLAQSIGEALHLTGPMLQGTAIDGKQSSRTLFKELSVHARVFQEALLDLFTLGPSKVAAAGPSVSALAAEGQALLLSVRELEAKGRQERGNETDNEDAGRTENVLR